MSLSLNPTRRLLPALALALAATPGLAQVTVADFESGLPAGWTSAGTAWTVGGSTGSSPNLATGRRGLRALGRAQYEQRPLAESLTGSLTSSALTMSHASLGWLAAGWSGSSYNGLSRFEILDASMAVLSSIATPQSDSWLPMSVNLQGLGLAAGDVFYFRAVDASGTTGYAWMAMDQVQFQGQPVPEPGTALLLACGLLGLALAHRRAR